MDVRTIIPLIGLDHSGHLCKNTRNPNPLIPFGNWWLAKMEHRDWGMSRSDYCRRQAELLFAMAFAAKDPVVAERIRLRAEQYLVEADTSDHSAEALERAIDDFNDTQMRGD